MNLYFDNASTSFPKPLEVVKYVEKYLTQGGTYGRAAYNRNIEVSRMVENTRQSLSEIIGTSLVSNVIFTYNSTSALNSIIKGFKYQKRNVLISPLEHNSVTRPLEYLRNQGVIDYKVLPHFHDGLIDINKLNDFDLKTIDLVIINHVSNVNGVIQPIQKIKSIIGDVPILVDASQSLGKVDFKADEWKIEYLAFTGHKGLLGPTGIGGFFIRDPESINPFLHGGTGSNSDKFDMPAFCPDKFEAGTQNILGIYGLYGAISGKHNNLYSNESFINLLRNLKELKNIKLICADNTENQSDVFSIIPLKVSVSEFSRNLYDIHGIEVRSGLHCATIAHQTLKTYPLGTIRFSLSNFHNNDDLIHLYNCIADINERL